MRCKLSEQAKINCCKKDVNLNELKNPEYLMFQDYLLHFVPFRMTFLLSALIILSFFSNSLHAEGLFKVINTKNGAVFLLGSIHLAKPDIYPLDPIIESAYSRSDNLVLEANPTLEASMKLMKAGSYQDSNTLEKNLTPDTYKFYEKLFKENNIQKVMYNKMKPWMAAMFGEEIYLMSKGYKPELGIDMHFLDKAKKDKKTILELESIDFQINLLDVALKDLQKEFAEYTMKDLLKTISVIDSMVVLWKKGDAVHFEKLVNESDENDKKYDIVMEKMLFDRNIKMSEKIEDYLAGGGTYFVIVGAAHLTGEKGIISLLEKKKKYEIR